MDVLLETPAISFAQASRFVLAAAEYPVGENPAAGTAYALALEKGWLPGRAAPDAPVKLGELCFLIMNALNIKGSFLYALFPGPRYAFRELDYRRAIPGRRDPALRVSGEELLRILELVSAAEWIELAAAEVPALAPEAAPPPGEAETPPVPDAAVVAEREQIAEVIRVELEQHEVTDTSVRVAEKGVVISLNNIQFMPDSVKLTVEEMIKLREIGAILARYPGNILVGGHTAMAGTGEGRLQISTERAQAVADFLIALGSRSAEHITVRGYGAEWPLGDNATEEGQAINRRVEITLLDEE
jgi:outer membrane protein OmpA-like peptidoglycan-associated protein